MDIYLSAHFDSAEIQKRSKVSSHAVIIISPPLVNAEVLVCLEPVRKSSPSAKIHVHTVCIESSSASEQIRESSS